MLVKLLSCPVYLHFETGDKDTDFPCKEVFDMRMENAL